MRCIWNASSHAIHLNIKIQERSSCHHRPLPYATCRWVKKEDMPRMPSSTNQIFDRDGRMAVLFESDWELNYFLKNNSDIELLDAAEV